MKSKQVLSLITLCILLIGSAISYSCSTTGQTSATNQRPQRAYTSLLDMLREQSQLTITGSINNATIRIRGNKTILGDNEPLFVVDGTPVGNYDSISSSIDVNGVQSIRVLSGASASIYGARGANGVIQISMKK